MHQKPTYEELIQRVYALEASQASYRMTEKEYLIVLEALKLINESKTRDEMLYGMIIRIKKWSDCEAVGIRIRDGVDYPYFTTKGFTEDFVKMEKFLCKYNDDGEPKRDKNGNPILECMCGNVLQGRFDPSKNFFTEDGCFWSNCTTQLLATTTDADRQARTRNRCNSEGYESVALIPLRSSGETFGLIQLNDHRKNQFSIELIALYRRLADHIASYLATFQAEKEKKRLYEQLLQSQKIESVGRLAGGIAHDLNNLLSPILGYSEMLMDDLNPNDNRREFIYEILEAGSRAKNLVHQLLAFSRKQTLEFQVVNLNDILNDFEKLLRRTIPEDVEISMIQSPAILPVMADIGQIEQVIMNLAINSADAMPDGGKLTIETQVIELNERYGMTHTNVNPGMYVMFSISDTGYGMSDEIKEQIFEPFYSTKGKQGTGLGLATVYGIVKQHSGNIWVYSEPNNGTTFKIYLPVTEKDHLNLKRNQFKTAVINRRGNERILLVEDNEQVLKLAASILKRQGYKLLIAKNGNEAGKIAASHDGSLDLLLTDVVMPGINGRELYHNILKKYPQIKVLYMSGYTNNIIAHRGVLEDGIKFIQKPFSNQTLLAKVREILDKGVSI